MLYIIRGLPGSGKSTLARKLAKQLNIEHYEADMFFTDSDGNYKFDPQRIMPAHEWCTRQVMDELYNDNSVIVSNTFTRFWEIEDYLTTAEKLNIPVTIIECLGEYGSIHDVPDDVYKKMKSRYVPNSKLIDGSFTNEIYLQSSEDFEKVVCV